MNVEEALLIILLCFDTFSGFITDFAKRVYLEYLEYFGIRILAQDEILIQQIV